jgi:hypothetical protein
MTVEIPALKLPTPVIVPAPQRSMPKTISDDEVWQRAEQLYKRARTGLQRHIKFTDIPDTEKHEWFRKAQRELFVLPYF